MASRVEVAHRIASRVGPGVLQIEDARDGWPTLATLRVEDTEVPVAAFVAPVTRSHRDRDAVERRFQNPGSERPIELVSGRRPLLLGLWEADPFVDVPSPVLVSADPYRRAGRMTRFSVFAPLGLLQTASNVGWSSGVSDSGERITCFLPPLLPTLAATLGDDEPLDDGRVQSAVDGAGLIDEPDDPGAAWRARRATSALVRDARFSRRVRDAYGDRCAMCGLGLGLCQGAHIYPASAPNSVDAIWNGFALCANHHLAFDRHLIAVHERTMEIVYHPSVVDDASHDEAASLMIGGTFPTLWLPTDGRDRPRPAMFSKRYEFFDQFYDWFL